MAGTKKVGIVVRNVQPDDEHRHEVDQNNAPKGSLHCRRTVWKRSVSRNVNQ
jgi:hypothetical protein